MKKVILILLFLVCHSAFGQTQNIDSLLTYSAVITVDSSAQKELVLRARQWYTDNFKSPKDVLQVNDIENGELSGKGSFSYTATLKAYGTKQITVGSIFVKISVWTKENKYKYEIGPFSIESMQTNTLITNNASFYISRSQTHPSVGLIKMNAKTKEGLNNWWLEIKKQCESEAESLIQSLQKAMQINYKGNW